MDIDKRTGVEPIPDDLKEVLNKAQWQALSGIACSGWKLLFYRRPLFQEPVLVVHNTGNDSIGVLEKDGSINMQPDIRIRDCKKISASFSI